MSKLVLFISLTIFTTLSVFGQGPFKITSPDSAKLPKAIKYSGKLKGAIRWTDQLGDNIVITVETGVHQSRSNNDTDGSDAEIFAFHYLVKDTVQQTWKVYDFIKDCPVDVVANFIKNTLQVTDLNSNGIGEVWLMYKTACRGDVSPDDMKIVMYEGQQKFAMRGQNKVRVSEKEFDGGGYKYDQAFLEGPKVFRDFALKMWNKNILQSSDE